MRYFSVIAMMVAVAFVPTAAPVAAQENSTNMTTSTTIPEDCTEWIDESTAICSESYDSESGQAEIVIYSERARRVTVTDVGGSLKRGPVNREVHHLPEGRGTITLTLEEYNNQAGVTIDTGSTLYAVPIKEQDDPIIGGPWRPVDLWIVGIISVVLGVASVPVMKRLVVRGLRSDRVL
jgi:hypothetical protein